MTGKVSGTPVASATFDLTVNANDANLGSVTGAGTYSENEEVTLTATAKAGGYFIKWQKDGEDFTGNTSSSIDVTVTADATYTAIFGELYSVTFSGLDSYKGTSGVGYTTQYADISGKWTAPQNYYYASEGMTLTKWNDGTNDYVPGTEYTLTENITVTPVFENAGSLNELTAETTVTWPFGTDAGAPTLSSEDNTQYYVQRASIAGNIVDLPIFVNTVKNYGINGKTGKFNNTSNSAYAQVNAGTVFKIPAIKGMVVKYSTNQTSAVTNIGFTDNTDDLGGDGSALTNPTEISSDKKTITYTYTGTASYLYLVDINGGKYPTSMSVTYPAKQTEYLTPTITIGDFNFENQGYLVTITASEGTLQVSTDGTTYTEQTSPYTTYATSTTTYYAKATGSEYDDSEVAEQAVTNTFDSSKKYVAWVYESTYENAPKNYALANDQLYTSLSTLYNVVAVDIKDYISAITDAQKTAMNGNLENADLVVVAEAVSGKSKGVAALKDIVGNVPLLSMKFFAYSNGRWDWATPKNASKDVVSITPESKVYKVFDGVTFNDDAIDLFDYPNEQNHIQYVELWTSEPTDDVVLAKTGTYTAVHASTEQKYFGLGLSCDDFTKYNANAITIVKNAAAMLIAGEALDAYKESTITKTITAAGYATLYSEYPLDFTGSGLTAYIATMDDTTVKFSEVESVPANTGVLLKGEEGEKTITVVASTTDVTSNVFKGVLEETKVDGGIYVLMGATESNAGTGFYKTNVDNKFTVGAHTAYLPANVAGARTFIGFDFEDNTTTGITSMHNSQCIMHNEVYNLNGQRVMNAKKGLYIVNGKKVIK
ncbi:MAG: hypothetical protein IJT53_00055 [Prevotella sp.]|nr:hypothetical protein [Prevotella sp.]